MSVPIDALEAKLQSANNSQASVEGVSKYLLFYRQERSFLLDHVG